MLIALHERGLYKREIARGTHDVTCPWVSEHTDAINNGAAYFEPDANHPRGGFKCQHSHGDKYRIGALLDFLEVDADIARGRARIDLVPGELNAVKRAAELSLAAHGDFYQLGSAIVTVRVDPKAGASVERLAAIVRLLLLTGMRVSELLSARWENVDLDRRTLYLPTSKTGRSRYVPLAGAALEVIGGLPRKGQFLFPNPRNPSKPLTTVKHGWQASREAAGLPDLRIHDLRHSAASFMVNSGVDLFAVGKVLGHASVQSTQRYSHLSNSTLLAAVEAGAAKQSSSHA